MAVQSLAQPTEDVDVTAEQPFSTSGATLGTTPRAILFSSIASIVCIMISVLVLATIDDQRTTYWFTLLLFIGFALAWYVLFVKLQMSAKRDLAKRVQRR